MHTGGASCSWFDTIARTSKKRNIMPRTVNACFTQLNTNIVNLDSKVRNIALSSRDNLITSLHTLSDKGLIPPSYPERDMYIGSFARKTKIRPLDDIDLMICFNGQGGHYEIVQINQTYKIIIPDRTTILSELRNEDNSLNSRSLLCLIRDNLSELHDFRMADIHYNKEACTLQLKSYTWNFDIVPCFYTTTDFYLIPDGYGNWKNTDPRIDNDRTTTINQQKNGQMLQWVRTLKYWKARNNNPWRKVSSYLFEQLLLNIASTIEFNQSFSRLISAALSQLSSFILSPVYDPKNIQGDLNTLTSEERKALSQYSKYYESIANSAITYEYIYDDPKSAVAMWKIIFGDDFPNFD